MRFWSFGDGEGGGGYYCLVMSRHLHVLNI